MKSEFILVASLLILSACGPANSPETSATQAIVSEAQAQMAFEIVGAVDYIPYRHIVDGCYARSLYMSMELAAESIPSTAFYIYGYLQPARDIVWTYHVAPLLRTEKQEWILDPAFQSAPLPLSKWLAKNKAKGEIKTEAKAGSAYFDEAGRTAQFTKNRMLQNFEEMPAFLTGDIASACTSLYAYIAEQYPSPELMQVQRDKLILRTRDLLGRLKILGKVEFSNLDEKLLGNPCAAAVAP